MNSGAPVNKLRCAVRTDEEVSGLDRVDLIQTPGELESDEGTDTTTQHSEGYVEIWLDFFDQFCHQVGEVAVRRLHQTLFPSGGLNGAYVNPSIHLIDEPVKLRRTAAGMGQAKESNPCVWSRVRSPYP